MELLIISRDEAVHAMTSENSKQSGWPGTCLVENLDSVLSGQINNTSRLGRPACLLLKCSEALLRQ